MILLICGIQKNDAGELVYRREKDSEISRWACGCQGGKVGRRNVLGVAIGIATLLYIKQIINKDLLYNTENYT